MRRKKEEARIQALYPREVLDAETLKGFDDIVLLASHACEAPISVLSFIDEKNIHFKALHGIYLADGPREETFCKFVVTEAKPFLFYDALKDEEFQNSPVVMGAPYVRFYAGFPIRRRGHVVGVLCVMDSRSRTLTKAQMSAMEALSRVVEDRLEARATLNDLDIAHQHLVSLHGFAS